MKNTFTVQREVVGLMCLQVLPREINLNEELNLYAMKLGSFFKKLIFKRFER